MFEPSKQSFPIKPLVFVPDSCNKCFLKGPETNFPIGAVKLIAKELKIVCFCHRWTFFDYGKFKTEIFKKYPSIINLNKELWQAVKKSLYLRFEKAVAQHLFKYLRTERYLEASEYNWKKYFSAKEIDFILDKFSKYSKNLDCVDNFRAAKINNRRQIKRFRQERDQGCCGSFDDVITYGIIGFRKRFIIGFNYGH